MPLRLPHSRQGDSSVLSRMAKSAFQSQNEHCCCLYVCRGINTYIERPTIAHNKYVCDCDICYNDSSVVPTLLLFQ